jgi:hypothetical protein
MRSSLAHERARPRRAHRGHRKRRHLEAHREPPRRGPSRHPRGLGRRDRQLGQRDRGARRDRSGGRGARASVRSLPPHPRHPLSVGLRRHGSLRDHARAPAEADGPRGRRRGPPLGVQPREPGPRRVDVARDPGTGRAHAPGRRCPARGEVLPARRPEPRARGLPLRPAYGHPAREGSPAPRRGVLRLACRRSTDAPGRGGRAPRARLRGDRDARCSPLARACTTSPRCRVPACSRRSRRPTWSSTPR